MKTIVFNGKTYPAFQAEGFAAKFAFPFAQQVCTGAGLDIGCARKEWAFPGATMVDRVFGNEYEALNLPAREGGWDYIFSSHCLEHLDDWVEALNYWITQLRPGGVLFLYLPHYGQEYWRPWNNRKHRHVLDPRVLRDYFEHKGMKNIFASERDLNDSFMIFCEK